jgi:hypothetical protein
MSKITNIEKMIFVTYEITPIPAVFENSLYKHLLHEVWGYRSMVDEDIRVVALNANGVSNICEIRYQFGEDYDEDLAEEIGELIDTQINVWSAKHNIADLVSA